MTPERIDAVTTELKKFAQELSLSDSQKEQLRTHLADKYARLQEFLTQNANISRTELVRWCEIGRLPVNYEKDREHRQGPGCATLWRLAGCERKQSFAKASNL